MKETKASILFHPLFLLSLFILLCNDFYWKHHYHNWLTGKLSDVAGLIVLPVFLMAFLPKQKRGILLFTGLFFCWWKSPFSEPFLFFVNQTFSFRAGRVVDYSDLLAFPAIVVARAIKPLPVSMGRWLAQGLQWAAGTVTVFALCATSMSYRHLYMVHPNISDIDFYESFTQKKNAASVLQTLAAKGLTFQKDSIIFYPVINQQNLYYRKPGKDTSVVWQPVSKAADSTLYLKREVLPFYVIPSYETTINGSAVSFRNIRFRLTENKKKSKTTVLLTTFQSPSIEASAMAESKTKKAYQDAFKALFLPE